MRDALATHVRHGDVVALEGFTHLISYAAGHELIRQRFLELTLVRLTPDIIADQLVAAGVVDKLVFGFIGNSAVGSLHAVRRAVESAQPRRLELEEYSHFGLLGRYLAGASNVPFYPVRSYAGSDLPRYNRNIVKISSPFGVGDVREAVYVVPPLNPDVAIIHAQRADTRGNTQLWGILGPQQEVAFAAKRVVVVVEEIVEASVIRSDPNRTLIPAFAVDAVVECPRGAHPSYAQGYYDRDNAFYSAWSAISKDPQALAAWIQEWIYDLPDHAAYLDKLGPRHFESLRPRPALSTPVDYGSAL